MIVVSPTYRFQNICRPLDQFLGSRENLIEEPNTDRLRSILRRLSEDERARNRTLLLIDDCAGDSALNVGRKGPFATLSNNARHLNLSIIVLTQNMTSISRSFRDNVEALILFRTLHVRELALLVDEHNPYLGERKLLERVYHQVTSQPHHFLFLLFTSDPPRVFDSWDREIIVPTTGPDESVPLDADLL